MLSLCSFAKYTLKELCDFCGMSLSEVAHLLYYWATVLLITTFPVFPGSCLLHIPWIVSHNAMCITNLSNFTLWYKFALALIFLRLTTVHATPKTLSIPILLCKL